MQAIHGLRRSVRLIGCLAAVAVLGSALFATVANAEKTPLKPTAYIALGDSLSFGYKAKTYNENKTANATHCEADVTAAEKGETALAHTEGALCEPAASFEPGFVGEFGKKLAKTEKGAGNELKTVDLGCPGETSSGLIGHLYGEATAEYDPCLYTNLEGFPLKTEIGTSSELEAAASLISSKADGEVTAVSLQIGSNDELAVLGKCESNTYLGEKGFKSILECAAHEVGTEGYAYSGGLFKHILTNIGVAIGVLRGAGYKGTILLIGFYNPYATLLAGTDALVKVLNEHLEAEVSTEAYGAGVKIAQPFPKINPEAPVFKEGESEKETAALQKKEAGKICKYTEMCEGGKSALPGGDIHPTAKGYKEIAKLMEEAF